MDAHDCYKVFCTVKTLQCFIQCTMYCNIRKRNSVDGAEGAKVRPGVGVEHKTVFPTVYLNCDLVFFFIIGKWFEKIRLHCLYAILQIYVDFTVIYLHIYQP